MIIPVWLAWKGWMILALLLHQLVPSWPDVLYIQVNNVDVEGLGRTVVEPSLLGRPVVSPLCLSKRRPISRLDPMAFFFGNRLHGTALKVAGDDAIEHHLYLEDETHQSEEGWALWRQGSIANTSPNTGGVVDDARPGQSQSVRKAGHSLVVNGRGGRD